MEPESWGEPLADQSDYPEPPAADQDEIFANSDIFADDEFEEAIVDCWRCRKSISEAASVCPYCDAKSLNPQNVSATLVENSSTHHQALIHALLWFAAMLAISVVHGVFVHVRVLFGGPNNGLTDGELLVLTTVVSLFGLALTIGAASHVKVPTVPLEPSTSVRLLAWPIGGLVLAGLLGLNIGYHWVLIQMLDVPQVHVQFESTAQWIWWGILITILPAVTEEFFFRFIMFDCLRNVVNRETAVWLSALIFGMAHIGQPFSIPVLIIIGVALAYLRLLSGGLALPMIIHCLHNAVVGYLEYIQ
jgi:uncharacterized protein